MTSFTSLSHYAPLMVALIGLSWVAGLWGLGRAVCICTGLRLISPWSGVVASLLGIQTVCLIVQLVGMAGFGSRPVLTTIWGLLVVGGIIATLVGARQWRRVPILRSPVLFVPLAIVFIAVTADLLVAVAPSTKIDEIYYHMLVPSRIVLDGALHFYRAPWVAAVWPQMAYEISSTPLHAIGYPDAPNVVSWALNALLLRFAWSVVRVREGSTFLAAVLIGALCVGLYPVVWHVTGGGHAMGDLAMAAAVVSFVERETLITRLGPVRYGAMTSILLLSGATSKVSLLPVCLFLLCLNAWFLLRQLPGHQRARVIAGLLLPWVVYYVPILVWTWCQSGSPFGPMLAGEFGSSIYQLDRLQAELRYARDQFQPSFYDFAYLTAINHSPLIWLGAAGLAWGTDLSRSTRAVLAFIFILQSSIIYFLLPHEARFLGGIHFGLLIVFATHANERIKKIAASAHTVVLASAIFLLPWLAAQLYYAKQFFPVALGLERVAFYQRNVAFFDDYVRLDKVLPKDAVLLAAEGHTSAVYAPRLIVFDSRDVPQNKRPMLFSAAPNKSADASIALPYRLSRIVYNNPHAVAVTYRAMGRPPTLDPLEVRGLQHK